jgi:hypothetical protein
MNCPYLSNGIKAINYLIHDPELIDRIAILEGSISLSGGRLVSSAKSRSILVVTGVRSRIDGRSKVVSNIGAECIFSPSTIVGDLKLSVVVAIVNNDELSKTIVTIIVAKAIAI